MSQFKIARLIITEDKSILDTSYNWGEFSLEYSKISYQYSKKDIQEAIPQHLYIISDDEIKEGDWIYNELSGIGKFIKNEEFNNGIVVIYNKQNFEVAEDLKNVKKIIATTDTLYKDLTQLSQQFIEEYIESYNKKIK